jgi:hypothetical protein
MAGEDIDFYVTDLILVKKVEGRTVAEVRFIEGRRFFLVFEDGSKSEVLEAPGMCLPNCRTKDLLESGLIDDDLVERLENSNLKENLSKSKRDEQELTAQLEKVKSERQELQAKIDQLEHDKLIKSQREEQKF